MLSVSDYLYSKASQNRIPLGGTFELSPVCNFSCKMCYVRKTPEQIRNEGKRLRSWEEWLALGRQCRDAGMLYLLLTGGEPFLYPGFRELYTQLHRMGLILSINTNGTLITRETVAWLKEYAPQRLNITLYGASRETYERVCGNGAGYDKAMEAIRMLHEAGIPVTINVSMIPENEADLERIVSIGKELEINTKVATYMFPPARREKEESDSRFTPEQTAAVFLRKARCKMNDAQYLTFLQRQDEKISPSDEDWGSCDEEFMRCRAGRSSCWVSWDGCMTACGIMQFPLTVYPFEEGFALSWNRLTDAVRQTPVLRDCAGCPKREICNPCAAILYTETGDANQKAPYLCEIAQQVENLIAKELKKYGL